MKKNFVCKSTKFFISGCFLDHKLRYNKDRKYGDDNEHCRSKKNRTRILC